MSSFKQQFPDLTAVTDRFDRILQGKFLDFLSSTHARRQAISGNESYLLLSTLFSISCLGLLYYVHSYFDGWVGRILIACAALWLSVILLSARQWLTNHELLAKEVNMALCPIMGDTFNRTVIYASDEAYRDETRKLLHDSALVTVVGVDVVSDDIFTVFGDPAFAMREVIVMKREEDISGKVTRVRQIFKGVLVTAELPVLHTGETYISTEGDEHSFAHRTFWDSVFENSQVQELELEWNEFEKDLHVATSNPKAVYTILTPDFMQDLHSWWSEHKLNMRIAFKDKTFYLLLPETKLHINESTTSTDIAEIKKYATTLLRPLWRSLTLLESVQKK